eukprot:TRINITY_DN4885_c0_g1_i1.p1 TRINITY_DN4885_c0_g1~~TRINITY_DN4885_c0_g1_i1.p1  ORF type:complete len:639 (+),score=148.83 TRINITY_DN4885_c0_g1_i1:104-2020(+)
MGVMLRVFGLIVVAGVASAGVGRGRNSHRGPEQDFEPRHKFKDPAAANSIDDTGVQLKDGEHEAGEVKVGKRWEFPVAQPKTGMLWGTVEESRGGKRILAFRGVKHVLPPTGDLRFKPPVLAPKQEGIQDAKHNGHVCPQHMATKRDTWVGDEDCLWLNIFTRDLVVTKKRPVIVWIHGGNFARGSAAEYDPDYLLDQEIVLVTIQYRLGMFGFLSTETTDAPGNYGMLDQVAALQWIKQNIESFSGDPDRITIMGQQAGGASVHYHLLSPLTRGLFHKAVSMSGTALCWWASLKRPYEKAKKLAKLVECPEDDKEKLVECLKEQPMEKLMNTHPNFYDWKHLEENQEPLTAWSPRVDVESPVPFMPREPIDVMTAGEFQHIPWITGMTDDEGAYRAHAFFSDMKGVREFEESYEKYGPMMFGLHDGQCEAPKIMAQRVKDFYWADKELDRDLASSLVDALTDSAYTHPIDTSAKIHFMKSSDPVYVYHFGYRGQHSLTHLKLDTFPPQIEKMDLHFGVGNGDDLMYMFPILLGLFRPLPQEDLKFSHRIIELLTSFANDGKPKIEMGENIPPFEWHPVVATNISHLNIGNQMEMDQGLPNHRRVSFWQSMPVYWNSDRDNYKPAPPPQVIKVHGGEL